MSTLFKRFFFFLSPIVASFVFLFGGNAYACSEIFVCFKNQALISARNFDFIDGVGNIFHTRVDTPRESQHVPQGCTPLTWKAKYASISFNKIFTAEGQRTLAGVDGMNTEGFKAGTYFLTDSRFTSVSSGKAIDVGSLLQYMLDTCSSVEQAINDITSGEYAVTATEMPGLEIKLHLFIHDANGESAIVEFIDRETIITRNPQVPVITNTKYDESLEHLKTCDGFGGKNPVGGTESSLDRFTRAAYAYKNIAQYAKETGKNTFSVWDGFGAIQSVAVPPAFAHGFTQWTIVSDIYNRNMYFRTAANASVVKIDLNQIAREGTPHLPEIPLQTLLFTHDMSQTFAE